jgi:hypothetical protein
MLVCLSINVNKKIESDLGLHSLNQHKLTIASATLLCRIALKYCFEFTYSRFESMQKSPPASSTGGLG